MASWKGISMGRTLRLFILLIIAAALLQSSAFADSEPTMRVGLATVGKPHSITVHANGLFSITNSKGDELSLVDDKDAVFSASNGIDTTIDSTDMGAFDGPLRLVPADPSTTFEIVSPKLRYNKYRGVLEINGRTSLSVVDELPVEDYVRGVLPMEVPRTFEPEAQKALTIAIRTYALTSIGRHKSSGFDVCDTTNCQGFSGASRDADWVDKLIDGTRGLVLTYQGKLIHAVYSTDCGGMTQNNEDAGFGSDPWPYLRSVSDAIHPAGSSPAVEQNGDDDGATGRHGEGATLEANSEQSTVNSGERDNPQSAIRDPKSDYCSGCPNHAWTKTYTTDELAKAFGKVTGAKIGTFQSMEFAEYDGSGRVKAVVVKGDKGEYRMSGTKFRGMFGETVIKSTRMTLTASADGTYTINGQGYGHGVGLCAYGANGLAKSGMGYADILKHYYTGIEIKAISDLGAAQTARDVWQSGYWEVV